MQSTFRLKIVLATGALAMVTSACATDETSLANLGAPTDAKTLAAPSPDGRYIITYKAQYKSQNAHKALVAKGGKIARELTRQNAVAAYLPGESLQDLLADPTIESIEVDPRRYALAESVPFGVPMVQADQVPAAPPSGDAGRIKVCIIDSGISAAHEDFAGVPINGNNVPGTGNWNEDLCGHGTHVAGTVAAAAGNGLGVVGVAPDAVSLHIVKVFAGTSCAWSFSSDLVAALDECTAAGAQVVSMSLGGGSPSNAEDNAFADAFANGVLSIAAAGNDGTSALSYPASYDSVVSVAALDSTKTVADFSQKNDQVELAGPGVGVLSTYPYANRLAVGADSYNGNQIEGAALGSVTGELVDGGICDSVGAWSGKVVLCQRGTISFFDKVMNAQNGGAAAAVLYNNAPGNFNGTLGEGVTGTIPAISLSQEDGQVLVAGSLGQSGNVLSGLGDGYAELNGTSMATPHVSAVAALIWAQVPTATNSDIRAALGATAEDLGDAGRDTSYGHGLVQARAALDFLLDGGGPDCSADNVCNPECADGEDPDCGNVCLPRRSVCDSDDDCCSGRCRIKRRAQVGRCR